MSWLVGRAGPDDFREPGRLDEMRAWLSWIGVDPTDMALCVAITHEPGVGYTLHLSQHIRSESGGIQLDIAADQVASVPVRVPVERDSWPAWLTGLGVPERTLVAVS